MLEANTIRHHVHVLDSYGSFPSFEYRSGEVSDLLLKAEYCLEREMVGRFRCYGLKGIKGDVESGVFRSYKWGH